MSISIDQANSFSQQVQNSKASARAQNNAVMDSYHQQVQEKRTADYVQGAQDTFKDLKAVSGIKDAVTLNSAKYAKPVVAGKKIATGVLGDEFGEKITRGAGAVAGVVSGGMDLYEDIQKGGVVGDNWAKQTENIADIAGGALTALSVIDPMLAPLAILGSGADLGAAFSGTVGDILDSQKASKTQAADEQSEMTQAKTGLSLAQSGQLEVARTE